MPILPSVNKPRIMISACLLGNPVRYDGKSKALHHPDLDALVMHGIAIGFCPEVAGGLPVPRAAAEISAANGEDVIAKRAAVTARDGADVTEFFLSGARQALALCREHNIKIAVLTELSPSCGSARIYDGSFTRNPVPGSGVTAALLQQHGIRVFNQHQLDTALVMLEQETS